MESEAGEEPAEALHRLVHVEDVQAVPGRREVVRDDRRRDVGLERLDDLGDGATAAGDEQAVGRTGLEVGPLGEPIGRVRRDRVLAAEAGLAPNKRDDVEPGLDEEVPDQPGGLAAILKVLDRERINVEYMYAFVERCGGNAVIIFRFDEPDKAIAALQASSFSILDGERLYSL